VQVVQAPCGFIYQLQLLSSWGDPYYIGLNGIEMYDVTGQLIPLSANSVCAYPESVNALGRVAGNNPGALSAAAAPVTEDVRTPDKLVDGVNDTLDGRHMWLAPTLPGILNRIYILFDYPVEISMLKIWNYAKTPGRGVRDFALLVDDLLVYNGTLDAAPVCANGNLPEGGGAGPQRYHTVLFTTDASIREREMHTQCRGEAGEQDVAMMNDRQVWQDEGGRVSARGRDYKPPVDQALRPGTSVPGRGRGGNKMR